ncbi:transmembrane protein, putative [Bodo saltans]|uniref:Transmembrane protein, putative n=1 Tax=Bodo saltans TaxID=75058 RepID=A0A0S4JF31_BODSA|nr:transmembrane protein, putative [Bodo saltans]|eukprot:CUG88654.1 transmembrane protein, putative [Bodo saltans]
MDFSHPHLCVNESTVESRSRSHTMSTLLPRRALMKKADPMPIIRRSRSWRGVTQARFDDNKADRKTQAKQLFIWAPLRVFGTIFITSSVLYVYMGHDQFMHSLMGYESEMQYEYQVNPTPNPMIGSFLERDRRWHAPVRNLEKELHPVREFDVMKDVRVGPILK